MPSSLYRLANKPHPVNVTPAQTGKVENEPAAVEPSAVVETQPEAHSINDVATPVVDTEPAAELADVQDSSSDVADVTDASATVSYPAWDPTWSKSQLLVVADQLGLSVTSINTKSEIVAALTAATSA